MTHHRIAIVVPFAYDGTDSETGRRVRLLGTTEALVRGMSSNDMPRVGFPVGEGRTYVERLVHEGKVIHCAFPITGETASPEAFSERMREAASSDVSFREPARGDLATLPWIESRMTPKGHVRLSIEDAAQEAIDGAKARLVVVDGTVRRTDCDTSIVMTRSGATGLGTIVPVADRKIAVEAKIAGHWFDPIDAAGLRLVRVPPITGAVGELSRNDTPSYSTTVVERVRRALDEVATYRSRPVATRIVGECRSEVAKFLRGQSTYVGYLEHLERELHRAMGRAIKVGGRPMPGHGLEACERDVGFADALRWMRENESVGGSPLDSPQLRRGKGPSAMAIYRRMQAA